MPKTANGALIRVYFLYYPVFTYIPDYILSLLHRVIDWLPAHRLNRLDFLNI
jgi:hypothetical protein